MKLSTHIKRTIFLAAPLSSARMSGLLIIITDVLMSGRVSVEDLAAISYANAFYGIFFSFGIGFLFAITTLVSQNHGARKFDECQMALMIGVILSIAIGLIGVLALLPTEAILRFFGQQEPIIQLSAPVVRIMALGLGGQLLFNAVSFYLEGIEQPRIPMLMIAVAVLGNIILNGVLMFGPLHLGAYGAALATSIIQWGLCLSIVVYVLSRSTSIDVSRLLQCGGWVQRIRAFFNLGFPTALATLLERLLFFSLTIIAGWISVEAVAAFEVCFNVLGFIFMIAIGIAGAAKIRVGNALGRKSHQDMVTAGWTGLLVSASVMLMISPILAFFPTTIAMLFVSDKDVIALAVPALFVASIFLIIDGVQGVMAGVLQGLSDVRFTLLGYIMGPLCVGMPAAYWLGYRLNGNVKGMIIAITAGFLVTLVMFIVRFSIVSKRKTVFTD